jgi:lysophospholipase L1-like esterase
MVGVMVRRPVTFSVVALLLLLSGASAALPAPPTAITVLPLGDSITYGCGDNCTTQCSAALPCADCLLNKSYTPCARCSSGYRLPLWRRLKHSGRFAPTFVGPLSEGPPDAPPAALAHGGWPGIRISGEASVNTTVGLVQVAAQWGPHAAKAQAVLLHIGTNDLLQNGYASPAAAAQDMGAQLAELLAVVKAEAPRARVFVATLVSFAPTPAYAALNAQLAAYNGAMPLVLEGFVAGGGRAQLVDVAGRAAPRMCSAPLSCCPGGIHPTVIGYAGMADVWYDALATSEWRR